MSVHPDDPTRGDTRDDAPRVADDEARRRELAAIAFGAEDPTQGDTHDGAPRLVDDEVRRREPARAGGAEDPTQGDTHDGPPRVVDDEVRRRELAAIAFGADEDDEPPRRAPLATSVERYELGPLLGKGGHGSVYRARDRLLGRDVALKLLASDASADAAARFEREARAAASLSHPNVVTVHDVGVRRGRPYYTMELIDGPTLRSLERGDPREIARVGAQVARGLHAAHERGVVHRDVKPANVVLAPDGRAVLVDFSIAREALPAERLTATGVAIGTPAYMSPEQALGKRAAIGPATDVYGLGATLYVLLTGRPPHAGESMAEVITSVLRDAPAPPSSIRLDLPPALETIVLRAMRKEPDARQPSAAALADELEAFLAGRPTPPAPVARPRRRRRRGPGRALVVGAAALALTLALSEAWRRSRVELALVVDAPLPGGAAVRPDERLALRGRATLAGLPPGALRVRVDGVALAIGADGAFVTSCAPFTGRLEVVAEVDGRPDLRRSVGVDVTLDPIARWFAERPPAARPALPLRPGLRCAATPGVYVWEGRSGASIELVHVPPGEFEMGTVWAGYAQPTHSHPMPDGYFVGRHEATWAEYRAYLAATGRAPAAPTGPDREPAAMMSWDEARAFATWLGLRLPSDAEWEKAARGPTGRHFPWGGRDQDDFEARCNYNDASCPAPTPPEGAPWKGVADGFPGPAPVGSFPAGASPYGALDMAGNVAEWCEDWFHPRANELYVTGGMDRYPPREGAQRCFRGGSWHDAWFFHRGGHRFPWTPDARTPWLGVRFALDEDPARR